MAYAILREELAVLVSVEQVFLIALLVAHGIWFLDTSARGSVVAGDG